MEGSGKRGADLPRHVVGKHLGFAGLDRVKRLCRDGVRRDLGCRDRGGHVSVDVAGVDGGDIEERTDYKLMREFIDRVFKKYLTPRERKILYLYYGLEEGSEAMTLEKIGALMGVTRERIRQIRERAFEKLRESPDGRALAGFWAA